MYKLRILSGILIGFSLVVVGSRFLSPATSIFRAEGKVPLMISYGEDGAPNNYASWSDSKRGWNYMLSEKHPRPTAMKDLGLDYRYNAKFPDPLISIGGSLEYMRDLELVEAVQAPDRNWVVRVRVKPEVRTKDTERQWLVWEPGIMTMYLLSQEPTKKGD